MSIPYLPLYVADYEADTAHLTIEEDGAYMRLLRLCWRTPGCSIPDDPQWIARRLRVSMADYERLIGPIIDEFFRREKARLFSPRLMREKDRIEDTSRKRSDAGKKGGRPAKAPKTNKKEESPDKANGKHLEPELEPELKERIPKSARDVLAEVIGEETADAFIEMRKAIKKPLTLHAANLLCKRVKGHPNPRSVFERSIENSWAGVFPENTGLQQRTDPTKHRTVPRPGGPLERPFKIVK